MLRQQITYKHSIPTHMFTKSCLFLTLHLILDAICTFKIVFRFARLEAANMHSMKVTLIHGRRRGGIRIVAMVALPLLLEGLLTPRRPFDS